MPGIEHVGDDFEVELPDTGAMELQGDAAVWDDIRVPVSRLKVIGDVNSPDFAQYKDDGAGSDGVWLYFFDDTSMERVHFSVQIPHTYKEGTDIVPHIHWSPINVNVGTVRWGLEFHWANEAGTFGTTTIIYAEQAVNNEQDKHFRTDFAAISGSGKTISSCMNCRVFRDAAHANDTYVGDVVVHEFDFHYQKDTMGSRQIVTK